jgi:uncharacterized protein (DUF433 family)
MAVFLPLEMIVSDPQIRGGRPVIAGTSLRVQDIAAAHVYREQTVPEIASNYNLDIAQVHAALAYYFQHKDEFEAQFEADDAKAEQLRAELAAQGKLLPRE